MKTVALYFTGSDARQVEIATKAVLHIIGKSNRAIGWVFAVSPFTLNKIKRHPGINYVSARGFVYSRYQVVERVSHILGGKSPEMWFDTMVNHLCSKYKIKLDGAPFRIRREPDRYKRDPKECTVLFQSTYNPCDGYGSSGEAIALEAASQDMGFRWIPHMDIHDAAAHAQPHTPNLLHHSQKYVPPKAYVLYHTPNFLPPEYHMAKRDGATTALITMFETTRIPYVWPIRINKWFDKLIVPTPFCKRVFKGAGVTIPIDIVPLGVDPTRWTYKERTPPLTRPYRFLAFANARWDCPRKNFDIIVDAFEKKFGGRKDVELVIKSSPGPVVNRRTKFPSNCTIINKRLPQSEVLSLLHDVDCLVFPSSGEGFGLPPREAMATGLPVIVTNWGGLEGIANSKISYPLKKSGMKKASHLCTWLTDEPGGMELGDMAQISVDDLADIMNHIFHNQEEACAIGKAGYEYVTKKETYKHSVSKLYESVFPKGKMIKPPKTITVQSKEKNKMKLTVDKILKRKTKRYILFTVTNGSEDYSHKNDLNVRFKAVDTTGGVQMDPVIGRVLLPKALKPGEVFKGKLTVDTAALDDVVIVGGQLGLVTEAIKWHTVTAVALK